MSRFQILSLAGGGIRGAFITSYLMELEQKLGRPIADCFDLIAGTSTGGIIAAGLANGHSAEKMHDFYVNYGASIFEERAPYKAKGMNRIMFPLANFFTRKCTGRALDAVFRARFSPAALELALQDCFGDDTLGGVMCTRLIMPSVNLTKGEPHVFRSKHLPKAMHDKNIKLVDAVTATTAAPTYFPNHNIGGDTYIDGGVWASDPSMLAVAEAIRIQQFEKQLDPSASIVTDNIHLLSVGTGKADFAFKSPGTDLGLLFWASRIADVMGTSQSQGVHLPMKFFLGERYRHVNFKMAERWGLGDPKNMPELFNMGAKRAAETFDSVKEQFLENQAACFVPFTSTEGEISIDSLGL